MGAVVTQYEMLEAMHSILTLNYYSFNHNAPKAHPCVLTHGGLYLTNREADMGRTLVARLQVNSGNHNGAVYGAVPGRSESLGLVLAPRRYMTGYFQDECMW